MSMWTYIFILVAIHKMMEVTSFINQGDIIGGPYHIYKKILVLRSASNQYNNLSPLPTQKDILTSWTKRQTAGGHRNQLGLIIRKRFESKRKLLHIELYRDQWPFRHFHRLPSFIRPRPVAKTGIRTFSTMESTMSQKIKDIFPRPNCEGDTSTEIADKVTMFIYMWVNPKWRGKDLGDVLLSLAREEIASRHLGEYMVLVHDDRGDGHLIRYYQKRGFHGIDDVIPKGMLCKLSEMSTAQQYLS